MNKCTLVFTSVMAMIPAVTNASSDPTFFGLFPERTRPQRMAKAPEKKTPVDKPDKKSIRPQQVVIKKETVKTSVVMPSKAITPAYYGAGLCTASPDEYSCVKIGHGDSWASLFPDETQRDLVQRLNRNYNALWLGKVIAVPKNMAQLTMMDISPFPHQINEKEKQIIVDQDKLAWVAYDEQGKLVKWGPIASGRDKCPDSPNKCLTLTGTYRVFSKEDGRCKSDIFPIGKGGAKMPYCMYFHKGFALHGSDDMPGYRASHGCVRMFTRDAKWLNEEFVDVSSEHNDQRGTKVVVRPVTRSEMTL